MDIVIRITGIVFIFMGVLYILKPAIMRSFMRFFKQGKRIYVAGLVRFGFAIIFLLGAGQCRLKTVILVFGVLFTISGLLVFTIKLEKLKSMIDWYLGGSDIVLRVLALIAVIFGAIIVYAA